MAGIHQKKASGSVCILHFSLLETALAEQCRLLVARRARDGNLSSEHGTVCMAKDTSRRSDHTDCSNISRFDIF